MGIIGKTLLALVAGIVAGGAVNMALVLLGPVLIAPPPGADMSSAEGIAAAMDQLDARHFLVPFLAHALGTFVGAGVAWLLAPVRRNTMAFVIGGFYLLGGIAAATMIPAPAWFIVLDLLLAYLPMAWLAGVAASRWHTVAD